MPITKVTEGEKMEPLWWLNHYKEGASYLLIRIHQLLNGTESMRKDARLLLETAMPEYAKTLGVNLDEVRLG